MKHNSKKKYIFKKNLHLLAQFFHNIIVIYFWFCAQCKMLSLSLCTDVGHIKTFFILPKSKHDKEQLFLIDHRSW
jgi:hypothetical protein